MQSFVYPPAWQELSLVPAARQELLEYTNDLIDWNSPKSHVKKWGVDDLVAFYFDTFDMTSGVEHLVGRMIFPDEAAYLIDMVQEFDRFLSDPETMAHANTLYAVNLPNGVVDAARRLFDKLKERGLPRPA